MLSESASEHARAYRSDGTDGVEERHRIRTELGSSIGYTDDQATGVAETLRQACPGLHQGRASSNVCGLVWEGGARCPMTGVGMIEEPNRINLEPQERLQCRRMQLISHKPQNEHAASVRLGLTRGQWDLSQGNQENGTAPNIAVAQNTSF
eukprot:4557861-Pleurochrysis_carterae.AAC.1